MAVTSEELSSTVIVKYQTGTSPAGAPIFRQKTLNNVSMSAAEQDIYDVAIALFTLIKNDVSNVYLRRLFELADMA